MAYDILFEPIKIGPVELKNRLVLAPMATHDFSINGVPTNQGVCYYCARAVGGIGMIDCGAIVANRKAAESLGNACISLFDHTHTPHWARLVQSVHSIDGCKIFAQMSPGFGRKSTLHHPPGASTIPINLEIIEEGMPKKALAYKPWWPSAAAKTPWRMHQAFPYEMPVDEIHQVQEEFISACVQAIQCGFDGIELHACHGYLMDQFLSPVANRRTDIYGGSLKNRARFTLDILKALKNLFGDAVPIIVRISGAERIEGGNEPEDMRQIAVWCEEYGANAIHLSDGLTTERYKYEMPDVENTAPGRLIDIQGKKLKKVIKIPVITPSIHDPDSAVKVIEEGATDMISLGRALLADPYWPQKVKEGKVNEIVKCTRCGWCLGMGILAAQGILSCIENPNYGREQYMPEFWPRPMKPKIPETLRRWRPSDRAYNWGE